MIGWSLGEFAHGIRVMKQVGGAADAPVEPAECGSLLWHLWGTRWSLKQ